MSLETPVTPLVTLQMDPVLIPRVKSLAQKLADLDARLGEVPNDRLDDEDREEIAKLRNLVTHYAATVLELVEPQAVIQDAIARSPVFIADLIGVMERFVKTTNEAMDEADEITHKVDPAA